MHRLLFTLPNTLRLSVPLGRHQPCIAGCILTVSAAHQVAIEGPHRDAVFDQARRFLKVHAKGHGPLVILGILSTPASSMIADSRGGRDSWQIIVGAEIAIVPTSMPGKIYAADEPAIAAPAPQPAHA
jgi:hypothetical protein